MKKILHVLISHIDLDGYGANFLFRKIGFDNVLEFNFDNGESIENGVDEVYDAILKFNNENFAESGDPETYIFIVDICPSKEKLMKLASIPTVNTIHIFDHHMTNVPKTEGVPKAVTNFKTKHDNGSVASGTSIFYEAMLRSEIERPFGYDHNGYIGTLVKYIACYDTYEWKNMGHEGKLCKELQTFFMMFEDKEEFLQFMLNQPHRAYIADLDGQYQHVFDGSIQMMVKQKLIAEQKYIDTILNDPNAVYIGNIFYDTDRPIMDSDNKVQVGWEQESHSAAFYIHDKRLGSMSEIANQYLVKNTNIDVFVAIDLRDKSFGFRTIRDDINTAVLFAEPNGGGGHPKASGCPMDSSIASQYLRDFVWYQIKGDWVHEQRSDS